MSRPPVVIGHPVARGPQGIQGEQGPPSIGTSPLAWAPSTAVVANEIRQAPDGSMLSANSTRTTRPDFDATEETFWTPVLAKAGTVENTALSAEIEGQVTADSGPIKDTLDARYKFGNRRVRTVDDLPESGLWSAHRAGGGGTYNTHLGPDGTLASARMAAAMGAHIIDCDYQLTSDEVPVVMHDESWDRVTDGVGLVSETPFALAPKVDMRWAVGDGWPPEQVPTLEEWISEFGGRVVLTVEIKGGAAAVPFLADVIKGYGLERSVLVNCPSDNVTAMNAITDAGLLLHAYACTTVAKVQAADAAGAWLIEIQDTAPPDVRAAAAAVANVQRVIAGPIVRRTQLAALPAVCQGFVSDNIGYLDNPGLDRRDIGQELRQKRVGPGWWRTGQHKTFPVIDAQGLRVAGPAANQRDIGLHSLAGAKPGTYSIFVRTNFSAYVGDTNTRNNIRICCPSDEGDGADAYTRGYVIGVRKNGNMHVWASPVGYGAGTQIGTAASTAISDAGKTDVDLRIDISPTHVTLTRLDTGHTTGPIANTEWRGDYMWAGRIAGGSVHEMWYSMFAWGVVTATLNGPHAAGTLTSLTVDGLPAAVADNARLRLPNGQVVQVNGAHAAGATTLNVDSFTLLDSLNDGTPLFAI